MWTKAFLLALSERAVKTFAQSLAALLVADGTDLLTTNWGDRLSIAGMAAVVSLLTSVATGKVTDGGPSLGNAETLNPAAPDKAVAVPVEDELPAGDYIPGTVHGLVNDALSQPYAGDSKTDATYHGGGQ